MNVFFRAATALAALAGPLAAGAADVPASPASAAASMTTPSLRCAAPSLDRAANHVCAVALAVHAEAQRKAGRNDAALAAFARADAFSPEDLRFQMARASLQLKLAKQMTPAGVDAATRAAPDDLGLAMMHAELSLAKKDWAAGLADLDRVVAHRPAATMAWEMRATANVARPDFDAARADVDQALRLEPKSPASLRLRGILRNNTGDYAGALADYRAAHALAPRPEDPFTIGSTQFLQRQFGDAASTLAKRAPPAPDGTYWMLWRYMALARLDGIERAAGSLGPATLPGQSVSWPVPVIDYFHGNIDASTLLDIAKKSQDARDLSQVCEAHFYMGEDALLRRRADAVALFRTAERECPKNFHEYEGAVAELRAAGVPPTALGATGAGASTSAPAASSAAPAAPAASAASAP